MESINRERVARSIRPTECTLAEKKIAWIHRKLHRANIIPSRDSLPITWPSIRRDDVYQTTRWTGCRRTRDRLKQIMTLIKRISKLLLEQATPPTASARISTWSSEWARSRGLSINRSIRRLVQQPTNSLSHSSHAVRTGCEARPTTLPSSARQCSYATVSSEQ